MPTTKTAAAMRTVKGRADMLRRLDDKTLARSNSDHLSSENASLVSHVESMAMRRLKKAEDVVLMARQLTAYAWEDRLEDCEVSDSAKHDSRELSTAVWLYDQEAKS